jgi:hypothetical protein
MFNIREYKFDEFGGGRKSKSAIDRYFERKAEDHREISEKLNSRGRDRESGEEDDAAENSSIGGLPLSAGDKVFDFAIFRLGSERLGRRGPQMGNPMSASPPET